jgi:hypothetical protein
MGTLKLPLKTTLRDTLIDTLRVTVSPGFHRRLFRSPG